MKLKTPLDLFYCLNTANYIMLPLQMFGYFTAFDLGHLTILYFLLLVLLFS